MKNIWNPLGVRWRRNSFHKNGLIVWQNWSTILSNSKVSFLWPPETDGHYRRGVYYLSFSVDKPTCGQFYGSFIMVQKFGCLSSKDTVCYFYRNKIEMLKSKVSFPGLAVRWLFLVLANSTESTTHLRDHRSVRESMLQGSCVIWSRIQKFEKTVLKGLVLCFIGAVEYGEKDKPCAEIPSVHSNAFLSLVYDG